MSRRASRIAAVEILYGADVRGVDVAEVLCERDDCDPYCRHLVETAHQMREALDARLGAHATGWRPDRMSPVDRNVLRVATVELLEADVPPAAVIDEAVDIAKHFSGEEAGRFVNGVLEAVRRELTGEAAAGEPGSSNGTRAS